MTRDAPVVVVRGGGGDADGVADAVSAAGGVVRRDMRGGTERGARDRIGSAERADRVERTDADALFAVGEDALLSLAAEDVSTPILPVDCTVGHRSVPPERVGDAVRRLRSGEGRVVSHPALSVAVAGEPAGTALADVTLMTDAPARISEYAISTPEERVGSFRADGVVVATPLGSTGYARAAGGPTLAPDTGVVAVPIAPYTTLPDSWVFRLPVVLSVERDEASVSLIVDAEERRSVPPHAPVELAVNGHLPFLRFGSDS
ncbi:sugar kinase [Halogeometricum pallidum JCM 14848]|uniref:Sugar kinase n=1 Tax=Halogeometricum pallidum JCM 14848 TaxID=1227487 RepID=M0CXC2_HALPD|nr:NAD(+)/NADH kinase [Halogeometricum pallidum]ELZ27293.1 sugar kinase [Halogeometricum pallidum JCM 14848]